MEHSLMTPTRKPVNTKPAKQVKEKRGISYGLEELIRPLLFEETFSNLKAYPGPPVKRARNI